MVPKSELAKLGTEIVRVKSLFGLTAIDPVKWNLADRGYEITRKKVGDRVDELRHQMFDGRFYSSESSIPLSNKSKMIS